MERRSHPERESKFVSQANVQFKYEPAESDSHLRGVLRSICTILDIECGSESTRQLEDVYFDDASRTLAKAGWSFRTRSTDGGSAVLTIKGPDRSQTPGTKEREEFEESVAHVPFNHLLSGGEGFRAFVAEAFTGEVRPDELARVLAVKNDRTVLPLSTASGRYELVLDKFYFFALDAASNAERWSEYYSEIEVEIQEQAAVDHQIEKLKDALTGVLGLSAEDASKYKRALKWASQPEVPFQVYCIALDIVGYSRFTFDVQKQCIQGLSRAVKRAIATGGRAGETSGLGSVVCIPTGDGMMVVFDEGPDQVLPIVQELHRQLAQDNRRRGRAERFDVRIGLHAGPVFKYSDVNESLNFAGDGINLAARVMDLGDGGHVLATREAMAAFGGTSSVFAAHFHPLGAAIVKHGVEVDVFNVHDRESQYGNPTRPTKLQAIE